MYDGRKIQDENVNNHEGMVHAYAIHLITRFKVLLEEFPFPAAPMFTFV
jgi:hypothetical protein